MPVVDVEERTETRTGLTPMYKVFCHDDPFTIMEFVVAVLMEAFKKKQQDAELLMLEVHKAGIALVDVMPLEEAEFRVEKAHGLARSAGFPLTFTYEPA